MNPSVRITFAPEPQTHLLCFLVATVAASYALTSEWRVDHVVESCRIWHARNRIVLPWLKRVTLGQLSPVADMAMSSAPSDLHEHQLPETHANVTRQHVVVPQGFAHPAVELEKRLVAHPRWWLFAHFIELL